MGLGSLVTSVEGRSAAALDDPGAEAAFLVDPNFGRHAGIICPDAVLIVLPLEVACVETALCGLSGLTDGRHNGSFDGRHTVRVGLLERSKGRWAEAASLDLSPALFAVLTICRWRFSICWLRLTVTFSC
jgi:hypothetical protein